MSLTLQMGYYTEGSADMHWEYITTFGNVRYSQGIAECGVSGVSTSQLSFEVPNISAGNPGVPYPNVTGAAIRLNGDRIFWINQRSVGRCITSFTCLDSVALLDVPVDTTNGAYIYTDQATGNKYLTAAGFEAQTEAAGRVISLTSSFAPTNYGFPVSEVEGKTLIQILTDITEIKCGYYAIGTGNNLNFIWAAPDSSLIPSSGAHIEEHSFLNIGGTFGYEHVLFVGKPDYINAGYGNDPLPDTVYPYTTNLLNYTTLEVNGVFTNHAAIDSSGVPVDFEHIIGKTFTKWDVENAKTGTIPALGDYFQFAQDNYTALYRLTDCEIRWVGDQMIASMGGGIPQTGELARRSRRQMETDSKLEEGKVYGNLILNARYQTIRLQETASSS